MKVSSCAGFSAALLSEASAAVTSFSALDAADIQTDELGLLDDPEYISGAGTSTRPGRQNVATLAASVSASILAQFVSLTRGIGVPDPLR